MIRGLASPALQHRLEDTEWSINYGSIRVVPLSHYITILNMIENIVKFYKIEQYYNISLNG